MHCVYEDVGAVKSALLENNDSLPVIPGRNRKQSFSGSITEKFRIGRTPALSSPAEGSLFLEDERIRDFTNWFIEQAFDHGELSPVSIQGYVGTIGDAGQLLDFIHSDPVAERITCTITTDTVNPSTLVFPYSPYRGYGDEQGRRQVSYLDKPAAEVPAEEFLPQSAEGGLVHFVMHQLHSESPLAPRSAKIFLAATYSY